MTKDSVFWVHGSTFNNTLKESCVGIAKVLELDLKHSNPTREFRLWLSDTAYSN